jgi:DNA modification methylase
MGTTRIINGDCRERLRELPDASVNCCVTSPPYFGLRDYGVAGQIGLEDTPDAFVAEMVAVFREVRRVLRDDATLWLNLGDSYASSTKGDSRSDAQERPREASGFHSGSGKRWATGTWKIDTGLPAKNLIGIPWRVAFALQADGWWLRQDIIWHKPNPMPESVTDRCTKAHEYLFLLTKSATYHYDAGAIAEKAGSNFGVGITADASQKYGDEIHIARPHSGWMGGNGETRNRRSVWTVATQPFSEAHFATFPPALIEPCILAGCPQRSCRDCGAPMDAAPARCSCGCGDAVPGTVLDPFGGAGTTGLVADRLGRNAILIELNPAYATMAQQRLTGDAGMLASVSVEAA